MVGVELRVIVLGNKSVMKQSIDKSVQREWLIVIYEE
jgi:hypothetical protein